jgi:hypothetical protein
VEEDAVSQSLDNCKTARMSAKARRKHGMGKMSGLVEGKEEEKEEVVVGDQHLLTNLRPCGCFLLLFEFTRRQGYMRDGK